MKLLSKFYYALSALSAVKQRFGLDSAAWLRGEDIGEGEGAKLLSPYSQSAWVYIAISVLAENVAQIPFRISRLPASARREATRISRIDTNRGKSISDNSWNSCRSAFRKRILGEN